MAVDVRRWGRAVRRRDARNSRGRRRGRRGTARTAGDRQQGTAGRSPLPVGERAAGARGRPGPAAAREGRITPGRRPPDDGREGRPVHRDPGSGGPWVADPWRTALTRENLGRLSAAGKNSVQPVRMSCQPLPMACAARVRAPRCTEEIPFTTRRRRRTAVCRRSRGPVGGEDPEAAQPPGAAPCQPGRCPDARGCCRGPRGAALSPWRHGALCACPPGRRTGPRADAGARSTSLSCAASSRGPPPPTPRCPSPAPPAPGARPSARRTPPPAPRAPAVPPARPARTPHRAPDGRPRRPCWATSTSPAPPAP